MRSAVEGGGGGGGGGVCFLVIGINEYVYGILSN